MKQSTWLCLAMCLTTKTQASALYFYEMATEDTALAGAGQAARAQDYRGKYHSLPQGCYGDSVPRRWLPCHPLFVVQNIRTAAMSNKRIWFPGLRHKIARR